MHHYNLESFSYGLKLYHAVAHNIADIRHTTRINYRYS